MHIGGDIWEVLEAPEYQNEATVDDMETQAPEKQVYRPGYVKAKVFTFTPEEIERAEARAQELEKDVIEEEKKPLRPVPLVKLGIGCGAFLIFFILFPLLVYGMRKIVKQVREWRKPRFEETEILLTL